MGRGGGGTFVPSLNFEPLNGSFEQSIAIHSNKFEPLNGSWIAAIAAEFENYYNLNLGSHLINLTYGFWLNNGLNNIYQIDEFGNIVYDINGEPIVIGQNEFQLINGNCWQSLFFWMGLDEVAQEFVDTYGASEEFLNYPYNGCWKNSVFQILHNLNYGVYPSPTIGEISKIGVTTDGINSMGATTYDISLDGDFNGTGATFHIEALSSTEIGVTIVDGGIGYNMGDVLFLPGDSIQAGNLSSDLYITVMAIV